MPAYTDGLKQIIADFSPTLSGLPRDRLLVKRLNTLPENSLLQDPAVSEAYEIFRRLKRPDVVGYFSKENWLLASSGIDGKFVAPREYGFPNCPPADAEDKLAEADLIRYMSGGKRTANALLSMLDDHRLSRILNRNWGCSLAPVVPISDINDETDPEVRDYGGNAERPLEAGEIAAALLLGIVPYADLYDAKVFAVKAAEWVKKITPMSVSETERAYLDASSHSSESFEKTLRAMIPLNEAQLRAFCLDPKLWAGSGRSLFVEHMPGWLPLLSKGCSEFPAQVGAVATAGCALAIAAIEKSDSQTHEEDLAAVQADLEQVKDLLSPAPPLAELLDRMEPIPPARRAALPQDAFDQLVQAAARATSPDRKSEYLSLAVDRDSMEGSLGAANLSAEMTPATKGAWRRLLESDDAFVPAKREDFQSEPALFPEALLALVAELSPSGTQEYWAAFGRKGRSAALRWKRAYALAWLSGDPLPPLPDAQKVAAEQLVSLPSGLLHFPPEKLEEAFASLSFDEQAAVLTCLQEGKPDLFRPLANRICGLNVPRDEHPFMLSPGPWRGKEFNWATAADIEKSLADFARLGRYGAVSLTLEKAFEGLTLFAYDDVNPRGESALMISQAVSDASGGERPFAAILVNFSTGPDETSTRLDAFVLPIWRDPAVTSAFWQKQRALTVTDGNGAKHGRRREEAACELSRYDVFLDAFIAPEKRGREPMGISWTVIPVH